jgi:hypothetical protein
MRTIVADKQRSDLACPPQFCAYGKLPLLKIYPLYSNAQPTSGEESFLTYSQGRDEYFPFTESNIPLPYLKRILLQNILAQLSRV